MKHPKDFKVLFLSKKDNEFAGRAAAFTSRNFANATFFEGGRKDKLPENVLNWQGDLLISFISSWVLPGSLLERAGFAAINFHPGSPEYPGIGCTNFAFYNGETEYGITAHYMKPIVDTGAIISVKRFPIGEEDTVYSVTQECYRLIEESFYEIMERILQGQSLPRSGETWKRKPYTRKQLDDLCEIKPGMSEEEIERRIRATTYKHPWAFTRIGGRIFKLQS
jgi:methionyl-tRNA formyltransferase